MKIRKNVNNSTNFIFCEGDQNDAYWNNCMGANGQISVGNRIGNQGPVSTTSPQLARRDLMIQHEQQKQQQPLFHQPQQVCSIDHPFL